MIRASPTAPALHVAAPDGYAGRDPASLEDVAHRQAQDFGDAEAGLQAEYKECPVAWGAAAREGPQHPFHFGVGEGAAAASPVPKYISSGVCPPKAEWGITSLWAAT